MSEQSTTSTFNEKSPIEKLLLMAHWLIGEQAQNLFKEHHDVIKTLALPNTSFENNDDADDSKEAFLELLKLKEETLPELQTHKVPRTNTKSRAGTRAPNSIKSIFLC